MKWSAPTFVATALLVLAAPAQAIDLDTNAVVNIVEGIEIVEDQQLNFGTLALNSGTLSISSAGVVSDPNNLTADGTSQREALFTVTSVTGSVLDVTLVPGTPPTGLLLQAMQFDFDGTTVNPHTMAGPSATLAVGAEIVIDRTSANTGNGQTLPYTVTVAFN